MTYATRLTNIHQRDIMQSSIDVAQHCRVLALRVRRFLYVIARAIGPILGLCSLSLTARSESYNVAHFGARYRKTDSVSARINDAAIDKAIKYLTNHGGGELLVSDSLGLSKTIPWPSASPPNGLPIPFAICGTANGELYDIDGGVLIEVPRSRILKNDLPHEGVQRIENIGIRGGSVRINGSGGCVSLRGVRIYAVEEGTALAVTDYEGGSLEANVHDNPGAVGFELSKCRNVRIDLTSRSNSMGGHIEDCSGLFGRLYCENNSGLGVNLSRLSRSSICWWLEANNKRKLQGRRSLCWGNAFFGMTQADSNGAWGDDNLSRLAAEESSPRILENLGELIASASPSRTIFPDKVETNNDRLTIRANAFEAYNGTNGQPNWVELTPERQNDCGGTWRNGDVFIVSITIVPDDATKEWYASNPETQLLFSSGGYSDAAPRLGERWRPQGSGDTAVMFGVCEKPGARFRLFVFPQIGSGGAGPDRDLSFIMRAKIRILRKG